MICQHYSVPSTDTCRTREFFSQMVPRRIRRYSYHSKLTIFFLHFMSYLMGGQWQSAKLETEGPRVRASPASWLCVFEKDTLTPALYWCNPDITQKIVDWDVKNQIKQCHILSLCPLGNFSWFFSSPELKAHG